VQLNAFRGYVRVTTIDSNESRARKHINKYLAVDCLGKGTNEGYGKIQWLNYKEEDYQRVKRKTKKKKFKIRKGLGPNYPIKLQKLLIALLLHDFVKVNIKDEKIRKACLCHHNETENKNELLPLVKYYDQLAAFMSRKKSFKTFTRYDYQKGKIDFEKLAHEIEERQDSVYKLYNYIYNSEELERIVEAMNYGKNSLRNHLLLMVNLAINHVYNGDLVINNKEMVHSKVESLTSATKVENKTIHSSAKDAEKHSTLIMNNADSESAINSMTEKARSIEREKE
jgi:hypothetical protein